MTRYTLGFIFNPELNKVLLVHKKRPEWQKGKLNGIGGHVENGEEQIQCIVREAAEESGLQTREHDWTYFGKIRSRESDVSVYTLIYRGALADARTCGDEEVSWFDARDLPTHCISNLSWLIPLAIDKIKYNEFSHGEIHYV